METKTIRFVACEYYSRNYLISLLTDHQIYEYFRCYSKGYRAKTSFTITTTITEDGD